MSDSHTAVAIGAPRGGATGAPRKSANGFAEWSDAEFTTDVVKATVQGPHPVSLMPLLSAP